MARHRTRIMIIADILSVATEDRYADYEGSTVTYLIKRANIPHTRMSKILKMLVAQGLMERSDNTKRYKISRSGREFLQAYCRFRGFADDFGLSI